MEKVVNKPRTTHQTSQAQAFRTYISARRKNLSGTDVAGGGKTPPTQRYAITE